MELTLKDSRIIKRILYDTLSKYLEETDRDRVYNSLLIKDEKTSNIIHAINLLVNGDYSRKIKDIIERFGDELASRLDIATNADNIKIKENESFILSVKVTNKFDIPLIFEIKLEDRDNFLPIIYDRIQEDYFNEFSEERLIDSEETKEIKFKISSNEKAQKGNTILFLVIKSREVEGLNVIHRIKIEIS